MTERIYDEGDLSATRLDDETYTIRHKHFGSMRLKKDYLPAVTAIAEDMGGTSAGDPQLQADYEYVTKVNIELKDEVLRHEVTISELQNALEVARLHIEKLNNDSFTPTPDAFTEIDVVGGEDSPKASTPSSSAPSTESSDPSDDGG